MINLSRTKDISIEEYKKYIEVALEDQNSKNEVFSQLKAIPNMLELSRTYVESLKLSINSAKETQIEAYKNLSTCNIETQIALIDKLLINANDELKEKILNTILEITRMQNEFWRDKNKTIERMNEDNNRFWKKAIKVTGVIVLAVVTIFASSKNDKS